MEEDRMCSNVERRTLRREFRCESITEPNDMKIFAAEFIKSCVSAEQFPSGDLYEIAFVGRSNVGKSSLINSLLNRRDLAKVSRTPGKDEGRERVSYFDLRSRTSPSSILLTCRVMDLPRSRSLSVIQWGPLTEGYLVDRDSLLGVVLLVDCRVVTEQDRQTITWLRSIRRNPLDRGDQGR
jgi:GTP-binding protein